MNIFRVIIYVVSVPIYVLGWPLFLARWLEYKADINVWDEQHISAPLYIVGVIIMLAWWGVLILGFNTYVY